MNKLMTCIMLAVSMVLTVPSEELNTGSQRAAIFMNPVNQVFSFRFEEKEITNVNEDMTEEIVVKEDIPESEEIEKIKSEVLSAGTKISMALLMKPDVLADLMTVIGQ